jgi:hypothetical protein
MIVTYSICVVLIIMAVCLGLVKCVCLRGKKPVPRAPRSVEEQEKEEQERERERSATGMV